MTRMELEDVKALTELACLYATEVAANKQLKERVAYLEKLLLEKLPCRPIEPSK